MRIRALSTLMVAAAVAVACNDQRSITTDSVGDLGFGQTLLKQSTNLPRGRTFITTNSPVASATPATDSIIVDLAGLDSLSSGQYAIWVGNDSATKFVRLTGNLFISKVDTTINAAGDPVFTPSTATFPNVSAFSNGRQNYLMRFSTTRALNPTLAATDSANVIIVSVETGTPGAAPSERRMLWTRRASNTVTADTLTTGGQLRRIAGFRFGNYAPALANEFVYATSVPARSIALTPAFVNATTPNIPRGRIEARGSIFTVNDSNYYRPPVGFFYEAWAIRLDTLGRFIDTVSLGRKASPFPNRISFYDADKTIPDPQYMFGTPTPVIYASQHRVSSDTIAAFTTVTPFGTKPYSGIGFVYVTLQNKAGPVDRMGAVAVMTVGTPGSILGR